jgi:hypothetical protein
MLVSEDIRGPALAYRFEWLDEVDDRIQSDATGS